MQSSYFQPPGIAGPTAATPPMMPTVGVGSPFVPLQGMPPTQPYSSPVPSMHQQFPPAMLQAGSYPPPASSVGSYPPSASLQPVPLQAPSAGSISTSTPVAATGAASASQNSVSLLLVTFSLWYSYFITGTEVLWCCRLGGRKGIRPVKNLSGGMLAWLSVWSEVHSCIWPSWCHHHSVSLASVKFQIGFIFVVPAHRLVLDEGPLNSCVCVYWGYRDSVCNTVEKNFSIFSLLWMRSLP